ncbi:MAG: DUF4381 domain-containing protein, partial [Gammaproteobacteria bacterium]|nr:DUF4381 domain-containing protein [Gammaproteobacteria bacterium]
MNDDIASQLRDIHLPDPVSGWPPAPGWWLLAALGLVLVLVLVVRHRRKRPRRASLEDVARDEITRLWADYMRDSDPQALVSGLSGVVRRVALARYPRAEVAGLTGMAWLEFLDRSVGGTDFTQGGGRVLIEAAYRPDSTVDSEAVVW